MKVRNEKGEIIVLPDWLAMIVEIETTDAGTPYNPKDEGVARHFDSLFSWSNARLAIEKNYTGYWFDIAQMDQDQLDNLEPSDVIKEVYPEIMINLSLEKFLTKLN